MVEEKMIWDFVIMKTKPACHGEDQTKFNRRNFNLGNKDDSKWKIYK